MTEKTRENDHLSPVGDAAKPDKTRRHLLEAGTLAGGALLLSAPHIRNAEAAQGQVWKIQSTWDSGTIDAADYVGPAINWDLGFSEVTKYIICSREEYLRSVTDSHPAVQVGDRPIRHF